jgi:hypothetical protein
MHINSRGLGNTDSRRVVGAVDIGQMQLESHPTEVIDIAASRVTTK